MSVIGNCRVAEKFPELEVLVLDLNGQHQDRLSPGSQYITSSSEKRSKLGYPLMILYCLKITYWRCRIAAKDQNVHIDMAPYEGVQDWSLEDSHTS